MNILETAEWILLICWAVALVAFFSSPVFILFDKKKAVDVCETIGIYGFMVGCIMFLLPIVGVYILFGLIFAIPGLPKKLLAFFRRYRGN